MEWQLHIKAKVKSALEKIDAGEAQQLMVDLKGVPPGICDAIGVEMVKQLKEHGYAASYNSGSDQREGSWNYVAISLGATHPLVTSFKLFD